MLDSKEKISHHLSTPHTYRTSSISPDAITLYLPHNLSIDHRQITLPLISLRLDNQSPRDQHVPLLSPHLHPTTPPGSAISRLVIYYHCHLRLTLFNPIPWRDAPLPWITSIHRPRSRVKGLVFNHRLGSLSLSPPVLIKHVFSQFKLNTLSKINTLLLGILTVFCWKPLFIAG